MKDESGSPGLEAARASYAELLEGSLKTVIEKLSALEGVKRVSLFGSYARGRRDLFTDLDILVVMDSGKGFVDRVRDLHSLLSVPVDMDLLCYTPEEFQRMKDRPFFQHLIKDEKVLYEKRSA